MNVVVRRSVPTPEISRIAYLADLEGSVSFSFFTSDPNEEMVLGRGGFFEFVVPAPAAGSGRVTGGSVEAETWLCV